MFDLWEGVRHEGADSGTSVCSKDSDPQASREQVFEESLTSIDFHLAATFHLGYECFIFSRNPPPTLPYLSLHTNFHSNDFLRARVLLFRLFVLICIKNMSHVYNMS